MSGFEGILKEAETRPPIISLLTDFGLVDGFVGVMKGVILSLCPRAVIVDITHDLPPQAVRAGAFLMRWAYGYMPVGGIHVAVVDPGVGTGRGILAMRASGHTFIAPDNGLLSPLYDELLEMGEHPELIDVTNANLWMHRVSPTFHGRDIFAPLAARLALGAPMEELGPALDAPRVTLELPKFQDCGDYLQGEILYMDRFGNLITNLDRLGVEAWLTKQGRERSQIRVFLGGKEAGVLGGSYGSVSPGEIAVVYDGYDRVEIAVNLGSARETLGADVGSPVRLEPR